MNYVNLGKRIREERLKLNLTQEQLAEYVDISASYIGQIERGERNLTLDTLVRIANRLTVSIDYLLNDSIIVNDDNLLNQIKQLFDDKSLSDKQMAIDVIRTMFSHLYKD
ncbi:helix-turn-helix domain-containing protein [Clostridium beijerinckii]|uniref:helix-turn-helix domain-containing protein n=1 Tax=Clostridium beijerinckii TaxID=1520 RepID=UPI00098C7E75|nr:helix-turn-helix transcriptional regulator [Clostridium beijerinckii]NRT78412.1 transcriptional regulator with XRE-family HTH domain [Clostridium beijerinckii]OOM47293.1 HTH-type transcriptional regulator ImmR [Clostridium beijerinckii]